MRSRECRDDTWNLFATNVTIIILVAWKVVSSQLMEFDVVKCWLVVPYSRSDIASDKLPPTMEDVEEIASSLSVWACDSAIV